jgi:hypothetical protein
MLSRTNTSSENVQNVAPPWVFEKYKTATLPSKSFNLWHICTMCSTKNAAKVNVGGFLNRKTKKTTKIIFCGYYFEVVDARAHAYVTHAFTYDLNNIFYQE